MKQLLLILAVAMFAGCERDRVNQDITHNCEILSGGETCLATYGWAKREIVFASFDNTQNITDSIVKLRQQQALSASKAINPSYEINWPKTNLIIYILFAVVFIFGIAFIVRM